MNYTPKFPRMPVWIQISGMSRTATYRAIARGDLKAFKLGGATLIDAEHGLNWLSSLPPVEIKLKLTHSIAS